MPDNTAAIGLEKQIRDAARVLWVLTDETIKR